MTQLPPTLAALGWTLVHFLWQGAIVGAVFGTARLGFRSATPQSRYALACSALLVMALLPLCTFGMVWTPAPVSPSGGAMVPSQAEPGTLSIAADWQTIAPRAMPWLLTAWGLGVLLLTLRLFSGWLRLRRYVRGALGLDAAWQRRVRLLVLRVGLRSAVRVLRTATVSSPMVAGCWRPTILLPFSVFTGLPVEHVEALLLHEMVHIRRWDCWVHRAQLVLETLFFYHPAIWWVSRTIHAEREFCCDAAVVSLTGDRLGYAHALTEVESLRSRVPRQALAFNGGSLMSRIRSIVRPTPCSSTTPLSAIACGLGAMGLVVALIAATTAIADSTHGRSPAWMPESVERWDALFEQASERHGIDPRLLSIVTLVESRGDPQAASAWGAVGLMQIMPRTAERIAAARGIDDFDVEDLRDPATNIDFGAWYLARQVAEFGDGSLSAEAVIRAAAAYNGGPKRLRRHLEDGRPLSEESERYSRIVGELWRERDRADSATLDRIIGREM